ncbi:type II secretion system protein N [Sphingomonas sp.]|jgi:general secretion pathway protein N|uniref:type II secretion system protein N n=1 Tax=Sphingomonas sp. TaxID=28214 RepID=UPI002EDA0826
MRRIRLATAPAALFGAFVLLALIAFLPLRLILGIAGVGDAGLSARAAEGSVWAGRLRDARFGDVALGDLDAHLSPWPLLVGRARIALDSVTDTPVQTLHGALGVSRTGVRADDLSATIAPGRLFAPLPVTALMLDAVSVRFEDGACMAAEGRVRATLAGDFAGVALPQALSGAIRCEGKTLLVPLSSQAGAERVDLRIDGDGRYRATVALQPADAAGLARLATLGFVQGAGGYVLSIEGRFR